MFKKAEYRKSIFQGLKSKVLFDRDTKGQVFCIAISPPGVSSFMVTLRTKESNITIKVASTRSQTIRQIEVYTKTNKDMQEVQKDI